MEQIEGHDEEAAMRALNESNAKMYRAVEPVCKKLELEERNVLGLYLYGSRLWGGATAASDYDMLVVVKRAPQASWTLHRGNVDALCMTDQEFAARLGALGFLAVLAAHWLPPEWRWKQHALPSPLPPVDPARFCESVRNEAERDWCVAAKKRAKGLVKEANKVCAHAVRMLRIAAQVRARPGARPNLWCTADLAQLAREDYAGTRLPAFLEEERERLLREIA